MRLPTVLVAAAFGLFEAAAGLILPNNAVMAAVLAAGGIGCVALAVYLDNRKTTKRVGTWIGLNDSEEPDSRPTLQLQLIEDSSKVEPWEGLTEQEAGLIERMDWTLRNILHGHSDWSAMVDDVRMGKALTRPCSVCEVIRTQSNGYDWLKGEPDE